MAGVVPAIHALLMAKTWMPGSRPSMTNERVEYDVDWLNTILQGVLLGGLYAMFAAEIGRAHV